MAADSADRRSPGATAAENLVWHAPILTRQQREHRNGHRGAVVWLTGLPGSGKSTIAHAVEARLHAEGFQTAVLDGDNIRHGLCADLGFSAADRYENIRRAGEAAKLFLEQGSVVFVALISPMQGARDKVRASLAAGDFIEIYCRCPLSVCASRDPKGMYARAAKGEIPGFTGVSAPYEAPLDPDLVLDTGSESAEASVARLSQLLLARLAK